MEAKLIFSILIILSFFSVMRLNFSNQLRIKEKLIFILIFIFIFIIIFNPLLLDKVAKALKIERGRDLLFYLFMITSTWVLIRNHIRINKLSSRINKITSQLSITSVTKKNVKTK